MELISLLLSAPSASPRFIPCMPAVHRLPARGSFMPTDLVASVPFGYSYPAIFAAQGHSLAPPVSSRDSHADFHGPHDAGHSPSPAGRCLPRHGSRRGDLLGAR